MDADKQIEATDDSVAIAAEIFSMLADATRIRIILALRGGELSVNSIANLIDKAPPAVSQHLAKLRLSRIVTTRQDGTRVFYRLANEHVSTLVIEAILQAEHSVDAVPAHHRGAAPSVHSASAGARPAGHDR
ncbi:ArsR/SmtB family transcription factor [Salinibacterium hongtaonis]|uniref:ArsR/SmtB family transcription factor n=1 Tax=Homoserinimonas hongtaonis TaxID=2079791 RepID=UPI000D350FC3|nr:metalloregulator ArsR/SmtB family transcription factor [Salinibacterium hongtaonis]AWB90040.1 transcriptional regulator [Salinibacterium hongtaonis]